VLKTRGLNHIDLGTKDMAATRAFYEDVLGFPLVRADLVEIGDTGRLQHFFFDIGNGQLMGFMSGEDVSDYPKDFDAGINKGLGLAPGVYHFAFDAETEQDLLRICDHLRSHGVKVRARSTTRAGRSRSTSEIPTVCSSRSVTSCGHSSRRTRGRRSASAWTGG